MNTRDTDEIEIDLKELFYVLKSRLWILILATIITAAGAGLISKFMITPIYQSTSKLYIVNKSASLTELSLSDLQLGTQLTKDYMVLIKSRPVTEQVIQNLGLVMTHEELLGIMTISNPSDTRILEIMIEYPDPYVAKQIVDEVASVSAKRMAVIMDMKEPNVVEEGFVSSDPSSPNVKKNAIIAAVIGLFLTAGVIILLHILDDTIKSSEDVERHLGITTIGLIPMKETEGHHSKSKKKRKTSEKKQKTSEKKPV